VNDYLTAFTLGNAAILANVCLLPLYPGMIVFLAGRTGGRGGYWLGVPVLAGVVTVNLAIGLALDRLQATFADIFDWLLPISYAAIVVLGVATLVGRNPFDALSVRESPITARPGVSAYLYGMMLAPMTLPCTGPIVVSAFVIGSVAGSGAAADAIVFFLFFSLGFGWPLLLLPVLALPAQRQIVGWTTRHHRAIEITSGVVLIGIAVFGWWTVVRPA
jgi:cytochrome c-type biogenesis protein